VWSGQALADASKSVQVEAAEFQRFESEDDAGKPLKLNSLSLFRNIFLRAAPASGRFGRGTACKFGPY